MYNPDNYSTGKTFTNLENETTTIEENDIALLIDPENGPQETFKTVSEIREFVNMNDSIYFFLAIKPTEDYTLDQLQILLEEIGGLNA